MFAPILLIFNYYSTTYLSSPFRWVFFLSNLKVRFRFLHLIDGYSLMPVSGKVRASVRLHSSNFVEFKLK
jgi:hypothetical protein